MSDYRPPALVPMNIADIIDAAVRLYRRNFGAFLSIIAIVYVPMAVFQVLLAYSMGKMAQSMPENPQQLPWEHLASMGVAYMGLILVNVLAVPIAQGALSVAVSRRFLGYPATVADAYGTIGTRWGRYWRRCCSWAWSPGRAPSCAWCPASTWASCGCSSRRSSPSRGCR